MPIAFKAPVPLILRALLLWCLPAGGLGADPAPPSRTEALQMLADVTLIDGECPNAAVDFGRALAFAEAMGLRPSEAMPAGALRPDFEAALRARLAASSHEDLCSSVAGAYAGRDPGLVRLR